MSRTAMARGSQRADAAHLFAALGDETRLRIIVRLSREGPLPIMLLARGAPVSRQAITKHPHALERAGLARSARAGRERLWEQRPSRLADVPASGLRFRAPWPASGAQPIS